MLLQVGRAGLRRAAPGLGRTRPPALRAPSAAVFPCQPAPAAGLRLALSGPAAASYSSLPLLPACLPALQYLGELEELQKEEERKGRGAAAMPFERPLAPVSPAELGFSGARLTPLVNALERCWRCWR